MSISAPSAAALPLVHKLFEQAAATYATSPAVAYEGTTLSYAELHAQAQRLSQALLHAAPAAELVAVSATRGPEMVVGVLAAVLAGKAYLPLDLAYPTERLRQLLAVSQATYCLCPAAEQAAFKALGLACITAQRGPAGAALVPAAYNDTVCVVFTSGSTGQPKGVCMTQAGLVQLMQWQMAHNEAQPGRRTLQFCHLSFDVSFLEVMLPLVSGGTVYLLDNATRLDAGQLLAYLRQHGIERAYLPYAALQYLAEASEAERQYPEALREVILGGEQLKITAQIRNLFAALPHCTLMHVYGPAEGNVWVTEHKLTGPPAAWPDLPHMGWPILDADLLLLDDNLQLVQPGEGGEIAIAGRVLAAGYLHQPARTAERFITWQHPQRGPLRVYRTGDLARARPDGSLSFLGRTDDQVKIRGNRVELGELEVVLKRLPLLRESAVVARPDASGQKQVVAYLVATDQPDDAAVRQALTLALPDYMQPAALVWLPALPRTVSDKVDKKALPDPVRLRPTSAGPYRRPAAGPAALVATHWQQWLQLEEVGADDNFFELGGNSLLAQKTVALLKQHGHALPITRLYQHPTAAGIANLLVGAGSSQPAPRLQLAPEAAAAPITSGDVAVVGMAGRFPGAASVAELWEVLREGRETIQFFSAAELDASLPAALRHDPLYVPARGVLPESQIREFDAAFFGLNPRLAELMDPQQRLFMTLAWEALEQTGHLPAHYAGRVGVFAGCGPNDYYQRNVLLNAKLTSALGPMQVQTANEKDYVALRTAYQLNLTGPAVSVQSACSTSLLAVAQAVQSIRAGHCEVALAGGVSLTLPTRSGHLYQEGAMLSRDGHCRPFDADATGTVFSDGAGVVVLKDLTAARRDGDLVLAVLKGVGVNNDGGGKGSFTAPSTEGQATAIGLALREARVPAASIGYVEAHGTGTPLGDPIELAGLRLAFGADVPRQSCALGSIKSNMGHLTHAAGVAGLIKAVLALHHRQLPPSLGFAQPNPHLDLADSPFFVNAQLTDWATPVNGPRRAGVSSFGVGGTNVHVVLEEADALAPPAAEARRPLQLLAWSAKAASSREAYGQRLATALGGVPAAELADAAFTLATTRADFAHRRFVVAGAGAELAAEATSAPTANRASALRQQPGEVVWLFPGQGAQYVGMGRALYAQEPIYRHAVDACAELLAPHLEHDLRTVLFAESTDAEAESRLRDTRYAQPALFVTEYALAQLWLSWGLAPTVLCGHSVGEFVAAHLAGIFTLADALGLVAARGRLVSALPPGRMLSVRLPASEVQALLPAALDIAASNSPKVCVVAGQPEPVAAFARTLDDWGIPNRPLATSHAFHSAQMEPAVPEFRQLVAQVALGRPQRPIVSTVTGQLLTDAEATSPDYWAAHLRQPVRFAEAAATLLTFEHPLLLEVGPGNTLATLVRQQPASTTAAAVVATLPGGGAHEPRAVLEALGQLWLHGLQPNWRAFYAGQQRQRRNLPAYAFAPTRCWVEPPAEVAPAADSSYSPAPQPVAVPAASLAPAPVEAAAAAHSPLPGIAAQPSAVPVAAAQAASAAQLFSTPPSASMETNALLDKLKQVLENASGLEMAAAPLDASFPELGLDSLLLTQLAQTLKKEFGVPLTFRQLSEDCGTLGGLRDYLSRHLPAAAPAPVTAAVSASVSVAAPAAPAVAAPAPQVAPLAVPVAGPAGALVGQGQLLGLVAQQLQLLAQQVTLLQGVAPAPVQPVPVQPVPVAAPVAVAPAVPLAIATVVAPQAAPAPAVLGPDVTPEEAVELKKPFGATARIERQATELNEQQRAFLATLTARYNRKTQGSKNYAQQHRARMADPRVVSGFRPLTKELVYPLVVNRSQGSRLWDIDGNEYIDILNGFGSTMFGYQPDFIKEALHAQVERGFEVGPQHELAGEVSELLCQLTGHERVALCNTGSEAVLGAMRVARTVTGRSLIVAFTGSYHGIVDEVLVRGTRKGKTFPAASGILPEAVQNMLILDYGTPESLRIIRERAHELAAVLVEPVQSRRPDFQPMEFVRELREITTAAGTALIFDEVITGFRMHLGGMQALWNIRADLATYGKVAGGGLSMGIIAGKSAFMDALDGGHWQYGDASVPEVGVTYFAGTFVRHPLALAATRAALLHLQAAGPALQQRLNSLTTQLADKLNGEFQRRGYPLQVTHYGSLWRMKFVPELPYGELLFTLLRERGIHVWDGFPCFLTEAHTEAELAQVATAVLDSAAELAAAGFWTPGTTTAPPVSTALGSAKVPELAEVAGSRAALNRPPVPGARLGRDAQGNPAWFVADREQSQHYVQLPVA